MLKRNITYVDFNDKEVTETLYFNISKTELLEMELSTTEGFGDMLRRVIETKDNQALIAIFKKIILSAYGQKSEDGKRFIKNETLRDEFSQTAAYNALFMELAMNDKAAIEFIRGIVPADMTQELDKELKTASMLPPPPPAA